MMIIIIIIINFIIIKLYVLMVLLRRSHLSFELKLIWQHTYWPPLDDDDDDIADDHYHDVDDDNHTDRMMMTKSTRAWFDFSLKSFIGGTFNLSENNTFYKYKYKLLHTIETMSLSNNLECSQTDCLPPDYCLTLSLMSNAMNSWLITVELSSD